MSIQVDLNHGLLHPTRDGQVEFFTQMLLKSLSYLFISSPGYMSLNWIASIKWSGRMRGILSPDFPSLMTRS